MASPARALAPHPIRPKPVCLADKIDRQLLAIQNRKVADLGLVSRVQLGIADDSAYFQAQANDYLKEITKLQGLTFEWNQTCRPKISEIKDGLNVRGGRQFESAADNCTVHDHDDWYLTVFDLLEGSMRC